jgi:hypothetical protein
VRPFGAQRTKYFALCDPLAHDEQNIITTNCNGGPDPVCGPVMIAWGQRLPCVQRRRTTKTHVRCVSTRWRTRNIIFTVVQGRPDGRAAGAVEQGLKFGGDSISSYAVLQSIRSVDLLTETFPACMLHSRKGRPCDRSSFRHCCRDCSIMFVLSSPDQPII